MPPSTTLRVRLLLTTGASAIVALALVAMPGPPAVAAANGSQTGARPSAVTPSDWTTFGHDSLRTAVDGSGSSFSPAGPAWTSQAFDGQLYGQPLVATGRVFAATENDTVYALAANTGAVLWSSHVGTAFNPSSVSGLCGNIHPTVGITSTPVIDPARSEIFVVATVQAGGNAAHLLVGLDIYTGAVLLNKVIDPAGTNPAFQLQRASLALTDGRVIVGFGGNASRNNPLMRTVTSMRGRPSSTRVMTSRPITRRLASSQRGRTPRR